MRACSSGWLVRARRAVFARTVAATAVSMVLLLGYWELMARHHVHGRDQLAAEQVLGGVGSR